VPRSVPAGRSLPQRADRLLVGLIRHSGGWSTALVGASVLLALAETALPAVLGRALDAVLTGHDLAIWLWAVAGLVLVLTAADALDDLASGMSTARATAELRRGLLGHVLALGTRGTRRFGPGDLATRLVANAAQAGRIPTVAVWTVTGVVPAVGAVVALALIDPWLCLTAVVALPVLVRLGRRFLRDASAGAERYFEVQAGIAGLLQDAVSGARTIAAANTEDREVARVLAPLPELHRHGMQIWRVQARGGVVTAVCEPVLEIAVLAVAGLLLFQGRISPGQLLAAAQYAALASGLGTLVATLGGWAQARAAAGRLVELCEVVPDGTGEQVPALRGGCLEFRAVTVRDGDRLVLDRAELVVPAGASVAVVGRSGSGKSLLAALAARLVDPDDGEVLLDGVALRRIRPDALRAAVAVAAAEPVLVGETVGAAIAMGRTDPAGEQVRRAARAADVHDVVSRLPQGYDTPLRHAPMSGGERQRLGLARAFVAGTRLLVLDDVAANLDTVTEHRIGQVLRTAFADRTRIVVAHRVSTAARADSVVWLDEGRIRRYGPHQQLWADPDYRAVFADDPTDAPW